MNTPLAKPASTEQAAIQSNRPTSITTIWADGEVYRTDAWNRTKRLNDIRPTQTGVNGALFSRNK